MANAEGEEEGKMGSLQHHAVGSKEKGNGEWIVHGWGKGRALSVSSAPDPIQARPGDGIRQ